MERVWGAGVSVRFLVSTLSKVSKEGADHTRLAVLNYGDDKLDGDAATFGKRFRDALQGEGEKRV